MADEELELKAGERYMFETTDGETIRAMFLGWDEQGVLYLRVKGEHRKISATEVVDAREDLRDVS